MASTDGINFQDATRVQNGATSTRRDAAKLTVSRTGASRSNTEGKVVITEYVRKMGGDPNNFQLVYKGAEEAGVMGLYLARQGDLGIMNVKIYTHSVSFHAGGCFDEFPKLRPAGTVDCHIEPATDAKGVPCLAVHTTAGTPTHAVKRSQKKAAPVPEARLVDGQGA